MSLTSRGFNTIRAGIRAALRHGLSQQQRTELKRLHGVTRKKLGPVLSLVHGNFGSEKLVEEIARRLPQDCEILMVHSSFDGLLPMYKGTAAELLAALIKVCGPQRTLVMPSFVMGGRNFDTRTYFQSRPFDVRRTPSEMGLLAELFRRTPGVLRSLHPTASICALGPLEKELTLGHQFARTGFSPDSPFGVMTRRNTAILGIGVEYFRCLTHAHTAGHALADEFPIKFAKVTTTVKLVDYDGGRFDYELGLPDRSRKLDLRILWTLLSKVELMEWRFHGVPMFVVNRAGVVTERLIEAARRGITIYGRVPVDDNRLPAGAELHAKESVR